MSPDYSDCSNVQLSYSLTDDKLAGDMIISRQKRLYARYINPDYF